MKLKYLAFGLLALLGILVLAPMLVPMTTYRDQAQRLASAKLGAPVTIDTLRIALLPTPRIHLEGITAGPAADIRVRKVAAVLDIGTLFDDVRVISELEIESPTIKSSAIALLNPLLTGPSGPAAVAVRRVAVSDARLEWPDLPLPALDAEIDMSDAGQLRLATVRSRDGQLALEARPQGAGYTASLTARQWTPPVGPPILFDSLAVQLDYAGQELKLPSVSAQLYGGKLTGSAQLDWENQWTLRGKFDSRDIELGTLSRLFSKTVSISGRISGPGSFSSKAGAADQLAQKLVLDYRFAVSRGVLHGMDLAKAASLFVRQAGQGGETQFDRLSGRLHMAGKQVELRDMQVASGLLAANGGVRVAADKKLHGLVEVELKKGLALVTVPLDVSGTTDAPVVMPTKAAIAGAAAGTAVLGPMGTSIGMKAGSMLDRVFGDKK